MPLYCVPLLLPIVCRTVAVVLQVADPTSFPHWDSHDLSRSTRGRALGSKYGRHHAIILTMICGASARAAIDRMLCDSSVPDTTYLASQVSTVFAPQQVSSCLPGTFYLAVLLSVRRCWPAGLQQEKQGMPK